MSLEEFKKAYKMWLDIEDFCSDCIEEDFRRDCNKCPVRGRWLYWFEKWVYMLDGMIKNYGKEKILSVMEECKKSKPRIKVLWKMKKLRDKAFGKLEVR